MPSVMSPSEARHIASLPKYKGQEYLARKLQLGPINEEDDLKSALLVDYYYDVFQYAVNRGMPWKEVVSSLNFSAELLQLCDGKPFVTGVRILQNIAVNYASNGKLSLHNAKLLSQYMTNTFLTHYKLYQYALTRQQEEHCGHIDVMVEVPTELMKLAEAESIQVWEYANKMHKIDIDEAGRKAKFEGLQHEIEMKSENIEQDVKTQFLQGELQPITMTEAENLISEVASTKMSLLQEDIGASITQLRDSADIALARQAVPLPQGWKNNQNIVSKNVAKSKSATDSRASSGKSTSSRKKK